MIEVKGREMVIPREEFNIGTTYDAQSEMRHFHMRRVRQGGIDLAGLVFNLDLEYANGKTDTATLTKDVTDRDIDLMLTIEPTMLQVPGTVIIQIRALAEDGTVKWSSYKGAFFVEDCINTPAQYEGKITQLEQYEAEWGSVRDNVRALNSRMDEIVKVADGIDASDVAKEVADARVGADGKKYESAGSAVREQITAEKDKRTAADASLNEAIASLTVFVTPQMFGAKGDKEHDDTQAFKDCIASAENKKCAVFIPSGNYLLSDTINISSKGKIYGDSAETTKLYSTADVAISVSTSYCTISDISLFGNAKKNTGIEGRYTYSFIDRVCFWNFNIAMNMTHHWGSRYSNLQFQNCNTGVHSKDDSGAENGISFIGTIFYDCEVGVSVYSGGDYTFTDDLFERVKNCFYLKGWQNSVIVDKCYFENCNTIFVQSDSGKRGTVTLSNSYSIYAKTMFEGSDATPAHLLIGTGSENVGFEPTRFNFINNHIRLQENVSIKKLNLFFVDSGTYFPFEIVFTGNQTPEMYPKISTFFDLFRENSILPRDNNTGGRYCYSDLPAYDDGNIRIVFTPYYSKSRQVMKAYITNAEMSGERILNVPSFLLTNGEQYYGQYTAFYTESPDSKTSGIVVIKKNGIILRGITIKPSEYCAEVEYKVVATKY